MSKYSRVLSALLVLALVLGAISVFVVSKVVHERRLEWRETNLKVAFLILSGYDAENNGLPRRHKDGAGRVLGSWRFGTLRYTGWQNWKEWPNADMAATWDAPANRAIASERFIYCFANNVPEEERCHTNIYAVTGPGTAFDPRHRGHLHDLPPATIVLIEVAHSGVHWMAPGDLSIDDVPESIARGVDGDGVFVGFADESVAFLRNDVPVEVLKLFFTVEGAAKHDRWDLLGPFVLRMR